MADWYTYVVECRDHSYYVGITNNPRERVTEHNAGEGSSWTRMRSPVVLRYVERHPDKSASRRREIEIKGWRREKKEALFASAGNLLLTGNI